MPVTIDTILDLVSDDVAEHAQDLIAEHRVLLTGPASAVVCGGNDHYKVVASERGVWCSCEAGGSVRRWCSHKAAAMVVWGEQVRE